MGQQIAERTAAARSEADAAKQELAALDQQSAALNQQIADRSAAAQKDADAAQQKLATLDQQIAARTAAARTETDAAEQSIAALHQQIADRRTAAQKEEAAANQTTTALKQQIADETARLAGLQRDSTQLRAETAAQKSANETQLSAVRDALNHAAQQRSEIEKAIADDSALRDRIVAEATEARAALAQTTGALADLRAQLKIESDVANAPRPVAPAPPGTDAGQPAAP